jgi:serine protease Do
MNKILATLAVVVLCLGLTAAFVLGKPQSRQSKNESESTRTEKPSKTAWLGVMTQTVDEDIADAFEVEVDYGAIINDVLEDSPAEKAEFKEGDVIISFNGNKVWDSDDLTDFVEDSEVGDKATIGIMRDSKEMTIAVELGSRPRGMAWAERNNGTPRTFFHSGPDDMQVFHWGGGGYIGVQLSELTDQLGDYFGVADGEGVLITGVSEDSPAEKAGLLAGDVITAVNDNEVSDYGQVKEIVSESEEGDKLAVTIVRGKKVQKVEVIVEESDGREDFGYQFFSVPPVPNVPDIDVRVPRIRGNFNRDHSGYFDYENYQQDMERFKADMEKYKEEMKALPKTWIA